MKETSLKQKLIEQELTIGSWLSFGFTPTCEIMTRVGFDWLVIDMEHTAIDFSDCLELIQIIENSGTVPLVRVGKNDQLHIKRAMDAGAHGVIVPMINTVDDAQKAIDALYYPPKGKRGVGLGRAQNYGMGFEQYKEWADEESILIVQIEHRDAVNNLESILSLEGIDGFIIGPYDLSGSLGVPGNLHHSSVVEALKEVQRIMNKHIKAGGYHIVHSNHQELLDKIEQGYSFIAYGDDMVFFAEKINEEAKFIQKQKTK